MTLEIQPLSREARTFLDRAREEEALPYAVRERAMARARAATIAGRPLMSQTRAPFAPMSRIRWAIAVALTCATGAAVGASSYRFRDRWRDAPPVAPGPALATEVAGGPPTRVAGPPAPAAPSASKPATVGEEPARDASPGGTGARDARISVSPDELRVLRRARAAVAREDFAAALPPIAEHVRRFRDGRLVEEREALRVKALAGLGRIEEARRAADAFARRFPHSVLLPAVSRLSAGD